MELTYYLSILWRRKWLILLSAILAGSLAYYLVSLKPPIYKSETILSTGVIDPTGINSGKDNPFIQKLQIDMSFNNLIQFVTSRRCINLLTFHLLNHDLDPEDFGDGPFRTPETIANYDSETLGNLNKLLATKLNDLKPEFERPEDELYFNKIAKDFKYDYETLKEDHIMIQRMGETDYVKISFTSEKPELSAFGASKFSTSFIKYFESWRTSDINEALAYLGNSASTKKTKLTEKQNELKRYNSGQQLVDLESQRQATVNQIRDLEQQKSNAQASINANEATIKDLKKLMGKESPVAVKGTPLEEDEDNIAIIQLNRKIVNLREQVETYTTNLIDGVGNKRKNESALRSVKKQLTEDMKRLSRLQKEKKVLVKDEVEDNTRENELFERHLSATIDLTNAKEEMTIIDEKLAELKIRSNSFVSNQAYVTNLEREINVARVDYEMVVRKLEEERLETKREDSPFTIIEHAQIPEKAESDKKALFTVFSGVVGASMATFFIFLLAFLDNTMHSPNQFKAFTGLPLIGNIIKINNKKLDLQQLFAGDTNNPVMERFKEYVRDLRFRLEKITGGNVFLITSPREDEGKSFLITILAHSLLLKQKKVLVIDTNFKRNTLSTWAAKALPASYGLHQLLVDAKLTEHFAVTSINSPFNNTPIESISNSGRAQSPLEGLNEDDFKLFLSRLSEKYDYVFMEGAALNEYADTKELIDFSDNVLAVFSSDSTMRQADKDSIAFLNGLGDKFGGSILNRINRKNMG